MDDSSVQDEEAAPIDDALMDILNKRSELEDIELSISKNQQPLLPLRTGIESLMEKDDPDSKSFNGHATPKTPSRDGVHSDCRLAKAEDDDGVDLLQIAAGRACLPLEEALDAKDFVSNQEAEQQGGSREEIPLPLIQEIIEYSPYTIGDETVRPTALDRGAPQRPQSQMPGAYMAGPRGVQQRCINLNSLLVGDTFADEIESMHSFESSTSNEQHLVEAMLVLEDPRESAMMHANPVDLERVQQKQQQRKQQQQCSMLALILVCIATSIIVGTVVGTQQKEPAVVVSTEAPTAYLSMEPSEVPSSAPTGELDLFFMALPNHTQDSILKGGSPQYLAWDWLSRHRKITDLSEWRKKQLFALASFFFAFEGENWNPLIKERWMSDTKHECLWFSTGFGRFHDGKFIPWPEELGGEVPSCSNNGKFTSLELNDLQLSGFAPTIPPEIGLLTSLSQFRLYKNDIEMPLTAILPTELYQLNKFTTLDFNANHLFGTLPSGLGMMTNLTELSLFDSVLSGSLPSELGLITGMTKLLIGVNSLSGSLPTELGRINSMAELYLDYNSFGGVLPSELGLLTNMTLLQLGNNRFSGTLPSQLGMMTNLRQLDLTSLPLLNGTIPTELALLTGLSYINMSGSPGLSGTIPDNFCSLPNSACTYYDFLHWEFKNCSLSFDCSDMLCGCDCPCGNPS